MRVMHLDIETYSSAALPKCGVYRYCDAPDFEILLLSYAFDGAPVATVDLACGEALPDVFLHALEDPDVLKIAHNAAFERVCFSKHLGRWLDPAQWRCTMVMAWYRTLPGKLADVAVALDVTEKKMEEGKDLIRYFSVPCKPTQANGGRTRNLPRHAPEKWATYKAYNAQDVETERAVCHALLRHPLPGTRMGAVRAGSAHQRPGRAGGSAAGEKRDGGRSDVFGARRSKGRKALTGLENPGSVSQLKAWLADMDMPMESLSKRIVQEKSRRGGRHREGTAGTAAGAVPDQREEVRIHGPVHLQGRAGARPFAIRRRGPHLPLGRAGWYRRRTFPRTTCPISPSPGTSSEAATRNSWSCCSAPFRARSPRLIRTAFIPKDGCRFIVADFSAIEARVLAWLAGEEWVLEEFRGKGKIYEATASRMFHIPQETIVRGHPNYEYRQKGKQATVVLRLRRRRRRAQGHGRKDAGGGDAAAGRCLARGESAYRAVLERAGQCRFGGD